MSTTPLSNRANASWLNHLWAKLTESTQPYAVSQRCTRCGAGWRTYAQAGRQPSKQSKPAPPFCHYCGAPDSLAVRWVGQVTGYGSSWEHWDWLPEEELPVDLQLEFYEFQLKTATTSAFQQLVDQAVALELPKRIDVELEARMQARIEVELATAQAEIKRLKDQIKQLTG